MERLLFTALAAAFVFGASARADQSTATTSTDQNGCKVVERKSSDNPPGSMSSSVTAGGGKVSGHTTGAGNSVTVHSGDGRSSSSVATAGGSGSSTVVTGSGTGDCTIYVDPGRNEHPK
jgi:hypothetical protein